MTRQLSAIFILFLFLTLVLVQKSFVSRVKASPSVYQGDLVLLGDNVTLIEGTFDINGSIVIKDNATLILKNALLNFIQNEDFVYNITLKSPMGGNPRLLVYNSTITSNYRMRIKMFENSTATFSNSTVDSWSYQLWDQSVLSVLDGSDIERLWMAYNASVVVSNSTISRSFQIYGFSQVQVYDSEIDDLYIGPDSVNFTISNLTSGLIENWNFLKNCSVKMLPGGKSPNVTLTNTWLEDWIFFFYGYSYATISNSTLRKIATFGSSTAYLFNSTVYYTDFTSSSQVFMFDSKILGYLYTRESSTVSLVNSTCHSIYDVEDESQVRIAWYLDVHVVDSLNQSVPSANVTVFCANGTVLGPKLTNLDGWTRFVLPEKLLNATGEYLAGTYVVKAAYEMYYEKMQVDMNESKQLMVQLDFVIPEFPFSILLGVFVTVTLIVVIVRKRSKFRFICIS